jgi:3-hydroxyisobutyrate dehydrogenase-like beta-hydroxyacid dehydrogenase
LSTIAYIGTGLLGAGFVEAACKRGETVRVWNRTASKAEALAAFGAIVCGSPAEAVRGASRMHLVLPDDAVVASIIAAFRDALAPDAVIVDHSTTLPALTAARSGTLNAEGVAYLHCPVFIGPAAAREAKGIIMVSGPEALHERVRAALEAQAERVVYFGARPDLAATYKLVGNGLLLGLIGLLSDVFSVAASNGVSPAESLKLLEFFNPTNVLTGRGRKMSAGDYTASFEMTMARKDIDLMVQAAGDLPLAVLPAMRARMDALIAEGHGAQDAGVMAVDAVERSRNRASAAARS